MKIKLYIFLPILLLPLIGAVSCANSKNNKIEDAEEMTKTEIPVPPFNADSAYTYVKIQTDFGPRVPNTTAHKNCREYLISQMKKFGAKVITQDVDLVAWDGKVLKSTNIIGSYNSENQKRILLCAHWDSRPYADNDQDKKNYHTPIDGANDGASGVGILLEIARQIQLKQPTLGIDIIFFDSEDYGTPQFEKTNASTEDSWCLGSQYWGRRPHVNGYHARFGILLDMVGGKNSTFYYEGFSRETASSPMKKIWKEAHKAGFGEYFVKQNGAYVTDDHNYVYQYAHIPCVDIINYDPTCQQSSFGSTWHTVNDTFENIDINTLKAVGQTVMNVIYKEQ